VIGVAPSAGHRTGVRIMTRRDHWDGGFGSHESHCPDADQELRGQLIVHGDSASLSGV
jgi:hypothetical protein